MEFGHLLEHRPPEMAADKSIELMIEGNTVLVFGIPSSNFN